MLISLLIPKNMQKFSQFYRLISKIVFFSTQKLQVRFPTGGAATGSLPGRPERLKNVPDHPVEAPVKITRWRSLDIHLWKRKKTTSLFLEHSIDFCKRMFYTLKLSRWNLRWYQKDIDDETCERFGPVVSPCRFANLRNNGAGQLTIWLLRFSPSILDQIKYYFFPRKTSKLQPTKDAKLQKAAH